MLLGRKVLPVAVAIVLLGCSSTPQKKETTAAVLPGEISKVREAALDALKVYGFEIDKSESNYLQGSRPHKVGLFVGSGGETVGIWLQQVAAAQTELSISTSKSFLGYAGQKDWSQDILEEIRKAMK